MDFIKEINNETLIISNSNIKELYLKENILKPIKFMNLNEFLSKYYFTYDEKTIRYIMDKYHIKYDIAFEYLENLYYLEDKNYENSKLDFLVNLKKELRDNDLLIYNDYFHNYLKRIKIIIYDIPSNDFLKKTLKDLDYISVEPVYHNYNHEIYSFSTLEEEVNYVAKTIAKLITEGVDIHNIKLANVSEDYYNILNRTFSFYNLKVNIPYKTNLTSYPLVKAFIDEYKNNDNIEDIITKLNDHSVIYNELIKIINRYLKYNDKELLIYKIENSFISSNGYDLGIELIDYLTYLPNDNEYIFMLNFNEESIPQKHLDTSYLTDNIIQVLGLDTTVIKNKYLREKTIKIINNIKNLTITYKEKDYKKTYEPSSLCDNYQVIKYEDNTIDSYSELNDKITLIKAYDTYYKYGNISDKFNLLNNNYQVSYNSYNHKYHKIDYLMDKLTLSYSKMNIYNKCAFRYYLSEILKLDIFTENFSTIIGSMVHYVMEKCLSNNDYDYLKYVDEYLKDKTFTKKEAFFLEKYKTSLKDFLDEIILEKEYSLFNEAMYEKKIDIDYGNNVHFVGIIDKVLYYISDDTTYISLIDYKTGADRIDLEYLKYGLDIQLPIYLYLSTKLPFSNIKHCGFYLQKFNLKDNDYRLIGYSNSNKDILSIMDNNYDNSKIIKGLKTLKDGSFASYSNVLSCDEMDEIIKTTENIIDNVIKKIKDNEFMINPKVSKGTNISCEYCKFKDICFMNHNDEIELDGGDL